MLTQIDVISLLTLKYSITHVVLHTLIPLSCFYPLYLVNVMATIIVIPSLYIDQFFSHHHNHHTLSNIYHHNSFINYYPVVHLDDTRPHLSLYCNTPTSHWTWPTSHTFLV